MLSDIHTHWPPVHPSLSIGHKQQPTMYRGPATESLADLHDPAWWTGFRITSPTFSGENSAQIPVRILKRDGTAAFPRFPDIQATVGTWKPFPWPIPARMATVMGLYLEIPGLDTHAYSLRVAFQEMSLLSIQDRYLFVEKGIAHHVWDGRRKAWGNFAGGAEPTWRTFHVLVPPMTRLISEPAWDDSNLFCIHAWDEPVRQS